MLSTALLITEVILDEDKQLSVQLKTDNTEHKKRCGMIGSKTVFVQVERYFCINKKGVSFFQLTLPTAASQTPILFCS